MTAPDLAADRKPSSPGLPLAIALIGALTIIRYIGLHYSRVDLFFDDVLCFFCFHNLTPSKICRLPLI